MQTDKALSPIFAFQAMRKPSPDWAPRFLFFGDMGKDGACARVRLQSTSTAYGLMDSIRFVAFRSIDRRRSEPRPNDRRGHDW